MNISTFGKYIDQPIILNKLDKKMPAILIGGGTLFAAADTFVQSKKKHKHNKKRFFNNSIVIASTIAASLIGTRGLKINGKKIINGLMERVPLSELQAKQTVAIEKYIERSKINDAKILDALNTAKTKQLSMKEIELLSNKLPSTNDKKELFDVILPGKKNLNSKEIFSEIKRLSLLGLIPIAGGVTGGIAADKITKSKRKSSDKIKEGLYQYLANIFLCNVGAGAALYAAERLEKAKKIKPVTPLKKIFIIFAGISTTGILGGSFVANYISKKVIDPMFGNKNTNNGLYSERKPEALDIALHADDIATAGILSGFKWIEPSLPIMYFVSGYRAGIGYRNGKSK